MAEVNINNLGQIEGMLVREPYWLETKPDKKVFGCIFTLSVPRSYKNSEGKNIYDYPEFRFEGTENQLKYLENHLVKGVFVKTAFTLQTKKYPGKDGEVRYLSYVACVGLPSIRTISFGGGTAEKSEASTDQMPTNMDTMPVQAQEPQRQSAPQQPMQGIAQQGMPQQGMNAVPAQQQVQGMPQSPQEWQNAMQQQQWQANMQQQWTQNMPQQQAMQQQQWTQNIPQQQPMQGMAQQGMTVPTPAVSMVQPQGAAMVSPMPNSDNDYDFAEAFVPLPDDGFLPFS